MVEFCNFSFALLGDRRANELCVAVFFRAKLERKRLIGELRTTLFEFREASVRKF